MALSETRTLPIILIILVISEAEVVEIRGSKNRCRHYCICDNSFLTCNGFVPKIIPNNTEEVDLIDADPATLVDGVFCHPSWSGVTDLTVECNTTCVNTFSLADNIFRCLDRVETLKINFEKIINFHTNTFSGLQNVTVLDLSGCHWICSSDLIKALSNTSILPMASKLVLEEVGIFCEDPWHFDLSQDLVDLLGKRRVEELNLGNTIFNVNFHNMTRACNHLVTLNISNADVRRSYNLMNNKSCDALRILDISGVKFQNSVLLPKHVIVRNTNITCSDKDCLTPIMNRVTTLYFNHVVSPDHDFTIVNATFDCTANNSINEIHLTGYNFINLDVEIKGINNLQYIDISNNRMQNIGPNVLKNGKSLVKINLAKNMLSRSLFFNRTFSVLFSMNLLLEEINIENNGLVYLPRNIFISNNMLQRLYLTGNRFKQIPFEVSHLKHLKVLDMRKNNITFLDALSRNRLDSLQRGFNKLNRNKMVLVDLRGNPFSCDCQSLAFLQWFVSSRLFASTKHMYICTTNGAMYPMNKIAVKVAEENCERPRRRRRTILVSTTLSSVGFLSIIAGLVIFIKYRKRKKQQKSFEDRVNLLQNNDFEFNFLTFLSFASEDSEFVVPHILQPLKETLKTICETERDLVCTGDRHFRSGHSIFSEMIRCFDDSAVFIAVMSKNYCKSNYCKREIDQACLQGKPIILILIEKVAEDEMTLVIREVFRNYTRVKFVAEGGRIRLQPDWVHVCESIIQLVK